MTDIEVIELVWVTINWKNMQLEVGSTLDLHFLELPNRFGSLETMTEMRQSFTPHI